MIDEMWFEWCDWRGWSHAKVKLALLLIQSADSYDGTRSLEANVAMRLYYTARVARRQLHSKKAIVYQLVRLWSYCTINTTPVTRLVSALTFRIIVFLFLNIVLDSGENSV